MSVYEKIQNREPGYVRHNMDIGAARQFCEMSLWTITKLRLTVEEERDAQCTFDELADERLRAASERLGAALRELDFVVNMLKCREMKPHSLGNKIARREEEKNECADRGGDI